MTLSSVSDATQVLRLRQDGTDLRAQLNRLTSELSSGEHADLSRALGGDFSGLADVNRRLGLSATFANGLADAAMKAEARQAALGRVESELSGAAPRLLSLSSNGSLRDLTLANANAPDRFEQAVAALNTRIAGVSLFSSDRPDASPLIPAEDMLDALRGIASTATNPQSLITDIDDWFTQAGGGYETLAWQGGDGTPPPVILSEGMKVDVGVTALDPAIRKALAGLALASLVAEGAVSNAATDNRTLISAAATRMQSGETALITRRAGLGVVQGRIDEVRAQTEATRAGLEIEKTRLMGADPYETATQISAAQARLESLYVLTSRLSRLSLSEYLR